MMKSDFDHSSILITGGTGSFGRHLIKKLLKDYNPKSITVYSRDEFKQYEMKLDQDFQDQRLRWLIGDVRDKERLRSALYNVDLVVHAAALKQVDTGESNPFEFIKTNVYGSQNLIESAIENGVRKLIALSTDKASSPTNLYGATKLTADKLFVAANAVSEESRTLFSVVRYGNVLTSRGSVIPKFVRLKREGHNFEITDENMTRFWITLDMAIEFVIESFLIMKGGEIFVPKIPTMKIMDLVRAFEEETRVKVVGIRPGEKIHEEMVSHHDAHRTLVMKDRYIILRDKSDFIHYPSSDFVSRDFAYTSDSNPDLMSIKEMRDVITSVFGIKFD
jgi:UDP-N-acetylglucosamine 4,6-dehydratase/5-epimerase